jgi:hypothetical protein
MTSMVLVVGITMLQQQEIIMLPLLLSGNTGNEFLLTQ